MARVRLVHWKAAEAPPLLDALRDAGHTVEYREKFRPVRRPPPEVFVIDLSRLPSHGREAAAYIRSQKSTRHIPIIFVGGDPVKVAAVRKLLPDAAYATLATLAAAVRRAARSAPKAPVVPPPMMERYSGRTAAQKLGIQAGSTAAVIDPPRDYAAAIGELPAGAAFEEAAACAVTLWFVHDAAGFHAALPGMRRLAGRSKLWILWRKGGELTQQSVRESAAQVGLVDYKICRVNESWSGMLFARRKS